MSIVIVACGVLVILVSTALLVRPQLCLIRLRQLIEGYTWLISLAEAVLRVVLGIVFVLEAPVSKFPLFIWVFGIILIVQGLIIAVLPVHLHKRFALWALDLTSGYLRMATLITIPFGVLLIYAVT